MARLSRQHTGETSSADASHAFKHLPADFSPEVYDKLYTQFAASHGPGERLEPLLSAPAKQTIERRLKALVNERATNDRIWTEVRKLESDEKQSVVIGTWKLHLVDLFGLFGVDGCRKLTFLQHLRTVDQAGVELCDFLPLLRSLQQARRIKTLESNIRESRPDAPITLWAPRDVALALRQLELIVPLHQHAGARGKRSSTAGVGSTSKGGSTPADSVAALDHVKSLESQLKSKGSSQIPEPTDIQAVNKYLDQEFEERSYLSEQSDEESEAQFRQSQSGKQPLKQSLEAESSGDELAGESNISSSLIARGRAPKRRKKEEAPRPRAAKKQPRKDPAPLHAWKTLRSSETDLNGKDTDTEAARPRSGVRRYWSEQDWEGGDTDTDTETGIEAILEAATTSKSAKSPPPTRHHPKWRIDQIIRRLGGEDLRFVEFEDMKYSTEEEDPDGFVVDMQSGEVVANQENVYRVQAGEHDGLWDMFDLYK